MFIKLWMLINKIIPSSCVHVLKHSIKQGDHDEALQLLPSLQQPATVQIDHYVYSIYQLMNSPNSMSCCHTWQHYVAELIL